MKLVEQVQLALLELVLVLQQILLEMQAFELA
jgi:hypothetical protein